MISSYKQLIAWQKSVVFVVNLYKFTDKFPRSEIFGITSQLRRAAVSIPSNIAEGYSRGHRGEYIQYLKVAYASGAECETQLVISKKIGYLSEKDYDKLSLELDEVMKMIYGIIRKIS